jgi:hypothetical protein
MTRLNLTDARCEALFASSLQPSDSPTPAVLAEAISRTVRQLGIRGCASRMAQEFGDHPEAASDRMRWIRQLAGQASDCSGRLDIGSAGPRHPPTGATPPFPRDYSPGDVRAGIEQSLRRLGSRHHLATMSR